MTSPLARCFPLSRSRERAGVRACRFAAAFFLIHGAHFVREPLIPTLLPQGEKG